MKKRMERSELHVELTTNVENIPQELMEKSNGELLRNPIIPAGTRLILLRYHERRTISTRVYISDQGELCHWVETAMDVTMTFEPMPTPKQISFLGASTATGRRAKAKRQLAIDVYAAISEPIRDFQSLMSSVDREELNVLHYLYTIGKVSLDDIEAACAAHPGTEYR